MPRLVSEQRGAAGPEARLLERLAEAVAAFDRGACAEEATGQLTPDLYETLPPGRAREAVHSAFRCLASDPPRGDREAEVRSALERLLRSTRP